jgi:hypothetical protein
MTPAPKYDIWLELRRARHPWLDDHELMDEYESPVIGEWFAGIEMVLLDGVDPAEILREHVAAREDWCVETGVVIGSRIHETAIAEAQREVIKAMELAIAERKRGWPP